MIGYLVYFIEVLGIFMDNSIKHIHMLGIGGTGMGSLAGLLKGKGYHVTGTDEILYPPMSTQLENLQIIPFQGYTADNLKSKPDLVIVGNVIGRDNPEIQAVLDQEIPYMSMPEAIGKFFLSDRESIVVAGTHGKTTTSNLISWLLTSAGADPSFMIGGVGLNFGASYHISNGRYFVIEGDEYDTAFFDKGSKFLHYQPRYAIISSIEFDHADIFENLDQIKDSFRKFASLIPVDGLCVANADDAAVREVTSGISSPIIKYGFSESADYRVVRHQQDGEWLTFDLLAKGTNHSFRTKMVGRHNLLNILASLALLMELGFQPEDLKGGLETFKGIRRRQEVLDTIHDISVIDDFAHHPTAIRETIDAFRIRYPSGRVWAIFEPRSNTTRRKVFEIDLAEALAQADKVILANIYKKDGIDSDERLNPERVVQLIREHKTSAYFIPRTDFIVEYVIRNVLPGDILLIMSNGAFDNIHQQLIDELKKRRFAK